MTTVRCFHSGLFSFGGVSSGLEQQQRRPLPAAETGRSCWGSVLIFQSPAKGLRKNQQTQPVRRRTSGSVSNQPSGLLLSPRVPIFRNVYRGDYCPAGEYDFNFAFGATAFAERSVAMKAPVGLLSGRAVCVSRWRGFAPTSSAERSKRLFTGGVVAANGICSAAFCESAALRLAASPSPSVRFAHCHLSQRERPWHGGTVSG